MGVTEGGEAMRASFLGTFEKTPTFPALLVTERSGVRFEAQSQWRVLILIAFFAGGFGCGLYVTSWFLDFLPGMLLGLFLVGVVKGGAHVAYLGRPERFWRALARPRTSWISRGLIGVALFLISGTLYTALKIPPLGWLAVAAAIFVMLYTGYLMAFSPSIPFWNSALLPLLFLVYSAESGTALTIPLYTMFTGAVVHTLEAIEISLLLFVSGIIVSYLYGAYHSSLSAREAVRLLVRGKLAPLFFVSVLLLGLAAPLAFTVFAYFTRTGPLAAMWLSALLGIQGALALRWAILRAGVYAPPRY
jgi:formate-dependent nitrite reductase membrane component NrfD